MGQKGTKKADLTKYAYRKDLNASHAKFVEEMAIDLDGPRAAKAAGYKGASAAWKLLRRTDIQRALSIRLREQAEESGFTAQKVLNLLETALFLDPAELFEPGDNGKWVWRESIHDIPLAVRQCITKVKTKRDKTGLYIEITLMDKTQLMNMALKYHRLIDGDGGHTTNVNLNMGSILKKVEDQRNNVVDTEFIESD